MRLLRLFRLSPFIPPLLVVPVLLLAGWIVFLKPPPYDRWGLPTAAVSIDELQKRPESRLIYPGTFPQTMPGDSGVSAQIVPALIEFGRPYHNPVAHSTVGLYTKDGRARVYAWYDRWLRGHDWRRVAAGDRGRDRCPPATRLYYRGAREEYVIVPKRTSLRIGYTQFDTFYRILPYGQSRDWAAATRC